jgi:hypothetical protein
MNATSIISFASYGLASLLSIVFGANYLLRSQFMTYHKEALGKSWNELDSRLQVLLLGLMRSVGGGFLAAGFITSILLLIPFRVGDIWAKYAIPLTGLIVLIPSLYAAVYIRVRTHAHTPVVAGIFGVGLIIIGIAFSLF